MKKIIAIILTMSVLGCAQTGLKEGLGKTWRTAAPEEAELSAWGIRTVTRDGIIFDRHGVVNSNEIQVDTSKSTTVKYKNIKSAKAELGQKEIGKLGMTYQDTVDKGYRVLKRSIKNKEEFIANINSSLNPGEESKWDASSIRIITAVALGFDYSEMNKIEAGVNGGVTFVENVDGTIVVSGDNNTEVSVDKEDGSILAYKYARICWTSKGKALYIQEDAPNPWYMFWSNSFDCPSNTMEERNVSI